MKKKEVKVLLVDDEVGLVTALQKLLMREGYQVDVCYHGRDALRLCHQKDFHIIFLDVNMPDLNGLETYREMRKIIKETPVVMITGYGRSLRTMIEEARQLGVRACLDKPFKIQNILDLIATYVPLDVDE